MSAPILPGQNKMSSKYERIRGGNGDFNSAQTCFHSLFWTFYSVLVIFDQVNKYNISQEVQLIQVQYSTQNDSHYLSV